MCVPRRTAPTAARSSPGAHAVGRLGPDAPEPPSPAGRARRRRSRRESPAKEICLRLLTDRARTRQELAQAPRPQGRSAEAAAVGAGALRRGRPDRRRGVRRAVGALAARYRGLAGARSPWSCAARASPTRSRRRRSPRSTPTPKTERARELVDRSCAPSRSARRSSVPPPPGGWSACSPARATAPASPYRVVREAIAAHGAEQDELGAEPPTTELNAIEQSGVDDPRSVRASWSSRCPPEWRWRPRPVSSSSAAAQTGSSRSSSTTWPSYGPRTTSRRTTAELVRVYQNLLPRAAYDLQSRIWNIHSGFRGRRGEQDYFVANTLYLMAAVLRLAEIGPPRASSSSTWRDERERPPSGCHSTAVAGTFASTSRRRADTFYHLPRPAAGDADELMIVELTEARPTGVRSTCLGSAAFVERMDCPAVRAVAGPAAGADLRPHRARPRPARRGPARAGRPDRPARPGPDPVRGELRHQVPTVSAADLSRLSPAFASGALPVSTCTSPDEPADGGQLAAGTPATCPQNA